MLTVSPLFSQLDWSALDEHLGLENYKQNGSFTEGWNSLCSDMMLQSTSPQDCIGREFRVSPPRRNTSFNATKVKKLSHNASERDRRKKINSLYSSLRSLLPATYRTKRLSIPNTVSQMVKYIPELQKEVDNLSVKKEALSSSLNLIHGDSIDKKENHNPNEVGREITLEDSSCAISTARLGDTQVVIQISTSIETRKEVSLSKNLLLLEKDKFTVMDVSSFCASKGRIIYNIYLHVEGMEREKWEVLNDKLLKSLPEKRANGSNHQRSDINCRNGSFGPHSRRNLN